MPVGTELDEWHEWDQLDVGWAGFFAHRLPHSLAFSFDLHAFFALKNHPSNGATMAMPIV
ncbi:hypothetical protein JCM14076_12640 [Methylosoma difficile]